MPAVANLIQESSTSTGTGNFTTSAVNGRVRFSDATYGFSTGGTTNVFDYFIANRDAAEWEIGTGHMSAAGTLVRDTVVFSSNANALVSFSAGTKDITNDVPAAHTLQTDYSRTLTVGYPVTPNNLGNITSFTVNPALGNLQYGTNHAAATWTAPASDGAVDMLVTNDATAGAITFSGFTVSASTGDALTTTNTQKFVISIRCINSVSTYIIKALQ